MKQKLITLSILVISLAGTMTSLGGSLRSAAASAGDYYYWYAPAGSKCGAYGYRTDVPGDKERARVACERDTGKTCTPRSGTAMPACP